MDNFKPYKSKPITRMAVQIQANDIIEKVKGEESSYYWERVVPEAISGPSFECQTVKFKAYEEPKVDDWIVRLTEDDTYHVTDAVFRERNIVPEEPKVYETGCFYCNGSKAGCPECD